VKGDGDFIVEQWGRGETQGPGFPPYKRRQLEKGKRLPFGGKGKLYPAGM